MILVSGCLLGINCRYDGGNNRSNALLEQLSAEGIVPVCPEQLGGLTTPRAPAEIQGGEGIDVLVGHARVVTKEGKDVTAAFLKGAEETLRLALQMDIDRAVLKARSPSCGCGLIYDGSFSGLKKVGDGVTAALLKKNGIVVLTEEDISNIR